jgi:CheY-like chemotaxis protein
VQKIPENRHKQSILLVEDHAATARAVANYLNIIGYVVDVASDASAARKLVSQRPFDILVCDIQLPDGNGWDLMRELNRKRSLPGIAMSGFASHDDIDRSEDAGFAQHLAKPFSPDDLTAALESLAVAK